MKFWKIRRKSDGLFYDENNYAYPLNHKGTMYWSPLFKNWVQYLVGEHLIGTGDYEVIEYEAVEKSVVSAEEFMS